ncbi:S1C family serine protease [Allobacillus sp. GCM10007491]|uniref:Trypsin-like peptidase domain-containing protein n=1 Tax=Allobacillus saliphilus TaxID=2912308 RepID=A0A941CUZ8_9BACI|nr:serine protease [Allobacillus saliphilus]MBR7553036.1 trypsin-like peptidase domain-containing protein [Allobacillus saliphilus]
MSDRDQNEHRPNHGDVNSDSQEDRSLNEQSPPETVDEHDLYENLTEEEIREIIHEQKGMHKQTVNNSKPKGPPFPKWVFWLIAVFMVINLGAALPRIFSIPAIDFLQTSVTLFMDEDMQAHKQSIALVDTGSSKGTGFSVHPEGYVITNHHVIEDREQLWVYMNEKGPYSAEVIHTYEEIDLAVLDLEGSQFPYLEVNEEPGDLTGQSIYFIGNPLRFSGIANEGKIIGKTDAVSIEEDAYMLDAPVYKGNSGSPVMTEDGQVIGVIYATKDDPEHGRIGLAIPIEALLEQTGDTILPKSNDKSSKEQP